MSSVKPRRRDISAALTKKAVLDAARHLFVTKGFDDTSIDEIARASESSNGAVYHHFRDKQEIFAELFQGSQTTILEATIAAVPPESGGWERVEVAPAPSSRATLSMTKPERYSPRLSTSSAGTASASSTRAWRYP